MTANMTSLGGKYEETIDMNKQRVVFFTFMPLVTTFRATFENCLRKLFYFVVALPQLGSPALMDLLVLETLESRKRVSISLSIFHSQRVLLFRDLLAPEKFTPNLQLFKTNVMLTLRLLLEAIKAISLSVQLIFFQSLNCFQFLLYLFNQWGIF